MHRAGVKGSFGFRVPNNVVDIIVVIANEYALDGLVGKFLAVLGNKMDVARGSKNSKVLDIDCFSVGEFREWNALVS